MIIPPEKINVCILRRKNDDSILFSRFKIMKYMMAKIQPEQIKYYGAVYEGSPDFAETTARIQEKVKRYYKDAIIGEFDPSIASEALCLLQPSSISL